MPLFHALEIVGAVLVIGMVAAVWLAVIFVCYTVLLDILDDYREARRAEQDFNNPPHNGN